MKGVTEVLPDTGPKPQSMSLKELSEAEYVSLATFRRNGKQVDTPVWAAERDGVFYVFSAGNAGKVKRLNNSPRARLATCTAKGKLTGPWHDAEGRILTDFKEIDKAYAILHQKYGWKVKIFDFFSKLSGKYYKRALLAIRLVEESTEESLVGEEGQNDQQA